MNTRLHRLLCVTAICTLALPLSGCSGGSPDSAAKAFYQAVADGDTATAKTYIDPAELEGPQGQMADAMLGFVGQMLKAGGGVKSIDVVSSTTNGDKATVRLKLTLKDGNSSEDDVHLVNKDGWKVTN